MTRLIGMVANPLAQRIAIAAIIALAMLALARQPAITPGRRAPAVPVATAPPAPALPDATAATNLPIDAEAARIANARMPFADPQPAAAPFVFAGDGAARLRAQDCLAAAALYEAGDDPPGERAVVQVVLNRVRHPAFPDSVCAVVFQGSERQTGCQFTFTCDGALARLPAPSAMARARAIAGASLSGAVDAKIGLATHYHADYVVPYWRDGLLKIAQQGVHLFYRWPGYWGSPAAMARKAGSGAEAAIPALAALSPAHAQPDIDRPDNDPQAETATMAARPSSPSAAPGTSATATATTAVHSGALELQLDPAAPPGSYALRALDLCGKTGDCRVAGRVTQDLAFLYVRRNGGEGAYWDCTRFQRADRAQCLPAGAALGRLLGTS